MAFNHNDRFPRKFKNCFHRQIFSERKNISHSRNVVINKTDLYADSHIRSSEYFCNLYQSAGYNIIKTSCLAEENIDLIKIYVK